jgi:hypothetical protein
MLFNVMERNLLSEYRDSTDQKPDFALNFIFKNRHQIIKQYGRGAIREMIINYRTYFKRDQKSRIVRDYFKYVMPKQEHHSSDLAIGYNIVAFVLPPLEDEAMLIDFMYSRLQHSMHVNPALMQKHFMKKHLIMRYIENNVLTKKRK